MSAALTGKVVVVTGAARGIGKAIALEAARAGAHLFLTDRDAKPCAETVAQAEGLGVEVDWMGGNLEDDATPAAIATGALRRFGRMDALVNAAGLTTRGSFLTGTAELWDQLFAINARAGFLLMQQAIRDMLARKTKGSIVNILSMNAYCGIPELAIYSATKGAMATLTRNAAHAHMSDRIRVNGINLGWVATETEHHIQSEVMGRGPDWQTIAAAGLPLGRLVTPEETARLAVFLLGDGSEPMSGVVIDFEQKVAGSI
jgi:NAD(P)-dependent dehydrogenase (short-subunit alcohol dehydrogenase family)